MAPVAYSFMEVMSPVRLTLVGIARIVTAVVRSVPEKVKHARDVRGGVSYIYRDKERMYTLTKQGVEGIIPSVNYYILPMLKLPFVRACVVGLLLPAMLNGCYFNSTGRMLSRAEYEARANVADLKTAPNPVVYTNGADYYVELPRYRFGKPVRLQYSLLSQSSTPPEDVSEKMGMTLYRIPADYALYLTGQGKKVKEIAFLEEVKNAETVKAQCRTLPVRKDAGDKMVSYTYTSPNAGLMRAAAPFNWLLVDMPVTVAENAVAAAAVLGFFYLMDKLDEDWDDDCDDDCHHHHNHHHCH